MMRAVIYCRCSTEEERQIDALKNQVCEAKQVILEHGWTLVDSYVESRSGTTVKGRAEYGRLFTDLLTDRFDIIVIKSQDRLMRNTKDWYLFLDRMQTNGKQLYLYMERKFFTTGDSLITGIKAILAEEYSRELSKKIGNAHRNRQRHGRSAVLTNRTFGFCKLADGTVTVNEEQREAVVRMFQYVEQYGCRTVAHILESEGVRSKQNHDLTPASIRRMVRNPLYKGICVMNQTHFDFDTKRTIKNPESEWIYVEGLVPAIVDSDLWQRANDAISKRAAAGKGKGSLQKGNNPGKSVLSGKLICGRCKRPYYRSWRRAGLEKEKGKIEWRCSGYVHHGRNQNGCDNGHLEEEAIYSVLERVYGQYFQSDQRNKHEIIAETLRRLEPCLIDGSGTSRLEKLEQEHTKLQQKKQRLLEKFIDEILSDDDYRTESQKLTRRIAENEQKQQELLGQRREQNHVQERLQQIKRKLEQGGYERAAVNQMLESVDVIFVQKWQLEIRLDTGTAITADFPFSPNTERGRYLDRLQILRMLKENPKLTAKGIAETLGRSQYMVWNRIVELKQEGALRYSGAGGKGVWIVEKEFPDHGSCTDLRT